MGFSRASAGASAMGLLTSCGVIGWGFVINLFEALRPALSTE
jgi:hypothetical protein